MQPGHFTCFGLQGRNGIWHQNENERVAFIGQTGCCVPSNVNDLLNLQYYQRLSRSLWLYAFCVQRSWKVHPSLKWPCQVLPLRNNFLKTAEYSSYDSFLNLKYVYFRWTLRIEPVNFAYFSGVLICTSWCLSIHITRRPFPPPTLTQKSQSATLSMFVWHFCLGMASGTRS